MKSLFYFPLLIVCSVHFYSFSVFFPIDVCQLQALAEEYQPRYMFYRPNRGKKISQERIKHDAQKFLARLRCFKEHAHKALTTKSIQKLSDNQRGYLERLIEECNAAYDKIEKDPANVYRKMCEFSPTGRDFKDFVFWRSLAENGKINPKLFGLQMHERYKLYQFFMDLEHEKFLIKRAAILSTRLEDIPRHLRRIEGKKVHKAAL